MEFSYRILRSKVRKKITISVERDSSVVVHAPDSVSDDRICKLVESKRRWIWEKVNHPQKLSELPHPPGKELINGESILYLGRHYRLQIQETESGGVEFSHMFSIPPGLVATRASALVEWYRARAREVILPRVSRHALDFGVELSQAKIMDNRYQWGSCTTKNVVCFNWRLIKAPMFVVDYVIAHELTHLLEANHTPQFWRLLRVHQTKIDESIDWLQQNGQSLVDD